MHEPHSSSMTLEPMNMGMILDRTFRLYFQNMPLMIAIVAIAYAPYFIFSAGLGLFTLSSSFASNDAGAIPVITIIVAVLTGLLFYLFVYTLSQGAATYAISQRFLGEDITVKEAYSRALSRFGTMLLVQLVVGLLTLVGLVFLIIPGIIIAIGFSLTIPVVMIENGNSNESRGRAWDLIKDHWWRAFGLIVIVTLINAVLGLIAGFFNGFLGFVASTEVIFLISTLIDTLINILVTPISLIAIILLYYDIRIRKEGFDLEMLARSLEGDDYVPPTPSDAVPPSEPPYTEPKSQTQN